MLNAAIWTARLNDLTTEANVPGAALGIWSGGQEILAAHGVLNSATQVPVTTHSVFQVGSITKIWTATMIMQLIDEGLLSLDTTVSEILPGARLGTADVGGQVTVRHLLTHTSGIDGDVFTDTGRGEECVERYVGLLAEVQSVFAPGFVLRSRDDEPWVPVSFGELADGTPYIYLSGRVTPRVG
jgi:CubicO group peptidase (beta-lactamase class C family)